jgi:predicted GTPase
MQELKEGLEMYRPLEQLKVRQTKIMLIGQIGTGKSSFFNTVNSIFRGYVTSQACSGTAEHSLTTQVYITGVIGLPVSLFFQAD